MTKVHFDQQLPAIPVSHVIRPDGHGVGDLNRHLRRNHIKANDTRLRHQMHAMVRQSRFGPDSRRHQLFRSPDSFGIQQDLDCHMVNGRFDAMARSGRSVMGKVLPS